eukprot:5311569-Prymnesium_polylepis.1
MPVRDSGAMVGDDDRAYWPLSCDNVQITSVNIRSLHNLPKRREQRPRYDGSCGACHDYVPELSGDAAPPDDLPPSSPCITVSLHPMYLRFDSNCGLCTRIRLTAWGVASSPWQWRLLRGQQCAASEGEQQRDRPAGRKIRRPQRIECGVQEDGSLCRKRAARDVPPRQRDRRRQGGGERDRRAGKAAPRLPCAAAPRTIGDSHRASLSLRAYRLQQ